MIYKVLTYALFTLSINYTLNAQNTPKGLDSELTTLLDVTKKRFIKSPCYSSVQEKDSIGSIPLLIAFYRPEVKKEDFEKCTFLDNLDFAYNHLKVSSNKDKILAGETILFTQKDLQYVGMFYNNYFYCGNKLKTSVYQDTRDLIDKIGKFENPIVISLGTDYSELYFVIDKNNQVYVTRRTDTALELHSIQDYVENYWDEFLEIKTEAVLKNL